LFGLVFVDLQLIPSLLIPQGNILVDPGSDLIERRARGENHGDASALQRIVVGIRDDPAPKDDDVGSAAGLQLLYNLGEKSSVGTGEAGHANGVDILLNRSLGDLSRCLMKPRVDHLVPGISERSCNHFGTAIVAIETGLSNENSAGHSGNKG
jgi:hypothetical protein